MGTELKLTLAYALPLALAALLFARKWQTRHLMAAVLVVLPCFYILHYIGLRELTGWASNAPPTEKFELIYEHVIEPDKKAGTPGAIYIWLATEGSGAPRAYRLAYTKPLHEEVAQAANRRKSGKTQIGQRQQHHTLRGDGNEGKSPYGFANRINRQPPAKNDDTAAR